MISVEEMMDAVKRPEIQALNLDAFSKNDILNFALQRSEILHDVPRSGRLIRAWSVGNPAPLLAHVEAQGDELARRAAAIIFLEYLQLKATIDQISPTSVADIGCGYAIFDLFLWKDQRCRITLIDLEISDEKHFGFHEKGAAYSDLSVAKAFLTGNGVDPNDIECLNPKYDDVCDGPSIDLAMSFISCGFHYPIDTYERFFRTRVSDDGKIILDLRARVAAQGIQELEDLGRVTVVTDAARGSARRVLVEKDTG
ncbi:hypothetical protein HW561_17270 [Rhodobacteraceae bacterium B1Z28]|uniref:Methyltransferase family protein n=1 Tax=Ruegeria haliotis TaxID=2747601 RepID=A0ABX2PTT5_9RHOB|nr:hypothetical protein [Ruegeria haliotis]NVO57551.1 hypothetical protein [Ruegeria haliotis]